MTYQLDPELVQPLERFAAKAAGRPVPPRGDVLATREAGNAMQAELRALVPRVTGVSQTSYRTTLTDGDSIELRWYSLAGTPPGSAVVFAHGGGMIRGSVDAYDELLSWYVANSGVPFLSVDYRLAPESPAPLLAEDIFAGLVWLGAHAAELGVAADRIAVMGDSGGGTVAAGAAILARDRSLPLARQILIYPMLDDRNQLPDDRLTPFITWNYDNNYTAWTAVLGDAFGTDAVSPIAAPARLTDHSGLAPAYIDVGELDIFRDEAIAYAQQLASAGVSVELHVHPGAPHAWERFAPDSAVGRRAMADRLRVIRAI